MGNNLKGASRFLYLRKQSFFSEYDNRYFHNFMIENQLKKNIKFYSMEISGNYYIKRTHAIGLLVGTNIYQCEENQGNY